MRRVTGDFYLETVCCPAVNDRPGTGGIVLWKNHKNFFTLVKGARGKNEISYRGCLRAEDLFTGRGRLVVGWIDRSIYVGAFPEGSAIRFESFRLYMPERG